MNKMVRRWVRLIASPFLLGERQHQRTEEVHSPGLNVWKTLLRGPGLSARRAHTGAGHTWRDVIDLSLPGNRMGLTLGGDGSFWQRDAADQRDPTSPPGGSIDLRVILPARTVHQLHSPHTCNWPTAAAEEGSGRFSHACKNIIAAFICAASFARADHDDQIGAFLESYADFLGRTWRNGQSRPRDRSLRGLPATLCV